MTRRNAKGEGYIENALSLPEAILRVEEMADLGYTESIVVNDLRKRIEQIEKRLAIADSPYRVRVLE